MLGAIASVIYRYYHTGTHPRPYFCILIGAGLAGLGLLRLLYTQFQVYDFVFVALLCALLFLPLYAYRETTRGTIWHNIGFSRLAFHSYSLYLTHNTVVILVFALDPEYLAGVKGFLSSILICNVIAVLFACGFEFPQKRVRALILRWLAQRKKPTGQRADPAFVVRPGPVHVDDRTA
jgi:peptidoglycan/LPS O-acetylase OafA/YrhL